MSKPVTYVMIKDSEYNIYKAQKRRIDELENQIKKHLKNSVPDAETTKPPSLDDNTDSSETEKLPERTPLAQTGAGAPDIKAIVQEFLHKLMNINYQQGAGTADVTESLPEPEGHSHENLNNSEGSPDHSAAEQNPSTSKESLPSSQSEPESENDSEISETESDSEHENVSSKTDSEHQLQPVLEADNLLKTVSSKQRKRASFLLHKLEKDNTHFRFNKEGYIFVDNVQIPDANFFQLFPKLFKPCNLQKEPVLKTVINELATLGYGHLLLPHYTVGLSPRGKNFIPNRLEMRSAMRSSKQWYCLAD